MSASDGEGAHLISGSPGFLRAENLLLLSLALIKLVVHLVTNAGGGYGYFRDELYYLACSGHLDLGYVDQPPLSIYILAVSRLLFGDSIFALRLLPAVAGAATVFLTGLIARRLGGGKTAQALASLASIVSIIYLGMNSFYSMNSFDILLWTLALYALIRLLQTDDPRYWLLVGSVLGLGLLNKIGVLWLGFGIFVSVLLTEQRRWFAAMWPWVAGAIALLLFVPFVIWNLTHDLAHVEFIRNAVADKYSGLSPLSFIVGQMLLQNPLTLPLWLAGLVALLFFKEFARFRVLGFTYVIVFLVLLLNQHAKAEYLSPIYGTLFAAGGVVFERFFSRSRLRWTKPAYILVLCLSGIVFAPFALPVLPVETYIRYAEALGTKPWTPENKELSKLPQFYADMFGWEEKAAAVARVFNSLSPEDKTKCAIFADNYGRCGAIDFFGRRYGLPKSIGRHNNYWIWGPRGYTGELVIILGGALEDKQQKFESVEIAGVATCDYCMPYENSLRVYLCRGLKVPLKDLWPQLKSYQ
jgi:hypothetical protein